MANLKSITELPVATSADGVNLIVNDNGYAKQIAAGAVGAQADWNVKDEANPAFVKNKPFYDTREYGTKTFSFDGDITSKEAIELQAGVAYIVKLYDTPLSKEEILSASAAIIENGVPSTVKVTEDLIQRGNDGNLGIGNNLVNVIYNEVPFNEQTTFTTGVWGLCILDNGTPVTYVSEVSWYGVTSGELKQIDEKYILKEEYDLDIEIHTSLNETTQEESMDLVVNSANFESAYEKFKANIMPKGKCISIDTHITSDGNEQCNKAILEPSQIFAMWDHTTDSLSESADGIMFRLGDSNSGMNVLLCTDNSVYI